MTAIHAQRGHSGPYEEPCPIFLPKFEESENSSSCEEHYIHLRILRKLNSRHDAEMQSVRKRHYRQRQEYFSQDHDALAPLEKMQSLQFILS